MAYKWQHHPRVFWAFKKAAAHACRGLALDNIRWSRTERKSSFWEINMAEYGSCWKQREVLVDKLHRNSRESIPWRSWSTVSIFRHIYLSDENATMTSETSENTIVVRFHLMQTDAEDAKAVANPPPSVSSDTENQRWPITLVPSYCTNLWKEVRFTIFWDTTIKSEVFCPLKMLSASTGLKGIRNFKDIFIVSLEQLRRQLVKE